MDRPPCPHARENQPLLSPTSPKTPTTISPQPAPQPPNPPPPAPTTPLSLPTRNKETQTPTTPPTWPPPQVRTSCADPLTWLGGPYAILLQFAAPGIALGSCKHSRFATDGLSRLRRTAIFILAVVCGTEHQREVVCDMIRRQHSQVRGRGYDARDVALQKWTAATLFAGQEKVYEVFYAGGGRGWWSWGWGWVTGTGTGKGCVGVGVDGPEGLMATREKKETLCLAYGAFASSLDMPVEMWPGSLDEFEEYFDRQLDEYIHWHSEGQSLGEKEKGGEAQVHEASKQIARTFLWDLHLPWWLRWMVPVMRLMMTFWLPPKLREAYGLPDPLDENMKWRGWKLSLQYTALIWYIWFLATVTPQKTKKRIFDWVIQDMKNAVEGIERTGRWTI